MPHCQASLTINTCNVLSVHHWKAFRPSGFLDLLMLFSVFLCIMGKVDISLLTEINLIEVRCLAYAYVLCYVTFVFCNWTRNNLTNKTA